MSKSYDTGFDKTYCYPNTHILKNRLNIHNQDELQNAEREYTTIRLNELLQSDYPKNKTFDIQHLKAIHKYLFSDIYDWAGKFRTVDIAKNDMFCRPMFITDNLEDIFSKLKRENYLKNTTSQSEITERLAYYLSEINAIHPFREGNGRTQRCFIKQLAQHNGYELDFSAISKEDIINASIDSFYCNYDKITQIINQSIKPLTQTNRGADAEARFGHILQSDHPDKDDPQYN